MNKNYFKIVKNCYLFLMAAFITVSCSKETVTDEISKIDNSRIVNSEKIEGEPDSAKLLEAKIYADEQFNYLRQFQTRLKSSSGIATYVGVIPNGVQCPPGVPQIIYHEDLESINSLTKWEHSDAGCFKTPQILIDGAGDVNWYVCIVDANTYNFDHIKYGYGVFALSLPQYFNGSSEVSVWIDDDNNSLLGGNKNQFLSPTYGFTRNAASNYYPTQSPFNNTFFWLNYFKADATSTLKFPDLGFSYSVFSNFVCCDWTNQNILLLDAEDSSPSNSIYYYEENKAKVPLLSCKVDNTYGILSTDKNVHIYLQNADVYRY
jgi:hypothetical protein